jgi:hypothetical protein
MYNRITNSNNKEIPIFARIFQEIQNRPDLHLDIT